MPAAPAIATPQPRATDAPRARGLLLRKCECGQKAGASGECEDCKKKKLLQRRASGPAAPGAVPSVVHDVMRSPGRPLDAGIRNFMEPRFGRDFGNVRIHDDARAAESARAVRAHAWTVGDHVAFAPGKFDPHSTPGRQLLAHELAHTVQQSGLQRSGAGVEMPGGHEDSRLEADADAVASRVMSGLPAIAKPRPAGRAVISRACAHDGGPPECGGYGGFPVPGAGSEAADIDVIIVKSLERHFGGTWVQRLRTPKNLAKPGGTGDFSDTDGVRVTNGANLQLDVVEIKSASTGPQGDGEFAGGCDKASREARGYVAALEPLKEILPKIARVATNPDNRVTGYLRISDKAALAAEGLDLEEKRVQQALSFYGSLVSRIGAPVTGFTTVSFGTAVGTPNLTYLFPEVLIPCTIKGNPGSKRRTLTFQTDGNGGISYRCINSACGDPPPPAAASPAGGSAAPAPVETLTLTAGTKGTTYSATVTLPGGWKAASSPAPVTLEGEARTFLKGMVLNKLTKEKGGRTVVYGSFSDDPTQLPVKLKERAGDYLTFTVDLKTGVIALIQEHKKKKGVAIEYPYLSPGEITSVGLEPDGTMKFSGYLNPTVPFLPKKLDILYAGGVLSVSTKLDKSTMRPPLPSFFYTAAPTLTLQLSPTFSVNGELAFGLGSKTKPIATGSIKVGADAAGVTATGTIAANIPGVDKADGKNDYANGTWKGQIVVETSQIKLPYVQNARLVLDIDNTGLKPSGEVALLFPRELGSATLGFSRQGNVFVYTGKGRFKVPGLKEVDVSVWYNGTTLKATAENIGFTWKGLNGTMAVSYNATAGKQGTVSGSGKITFTKGDFTGEIDAKLGDTGRFSGRGSVKYPFNFRGTRIDATAALIINEDQSVRVEGAIKLPQPVQLFRKFGDTRSLFHIQKNIPIPGASIGPVGVVAVIEGGIDVNYGIGPGELRNVALTAAFNPLAANPDTEVAFHCDLNIPAHAGISGTIGGGIGVDAVVASVTGTISVTASLNLDATAGGPLDAKYSNKRFELTAKPGINAALNLGLSLDAHARAEAGIGPFSVNTEKTWNLGSRKINLSQFGMAVPISYASDRDFTAPSISDIEWGPPPSIEFGDIMKQLFNGASASETTA